MEAVVQSLGQSRSSPYWKGRRQLEAICKKELHGCGILITRGRSGSCQWTIKADFEVSSSSNEAEVEPLDETENTEADCEKRGENNIVSLDPLSVRCLEV